MILLLVVARGFPLPHSLTKLAADIFIPLILPGKNRSLMIVTCLAFSSLAEKKPISFQLAFEVPAKRDLALWP